MAPARSSGGAVEGVVVVVLLSSVDFVAAEECLLRRALLDSYCPVKWKYGDSQFLLVLLIRVAVASKRKIRCAFDFYYVSSGFA